VHSLETLAKMLDRFDHQYLSTSWEAYIMISFMISYKNDKLIQFEEIRKRLILINEEEIQKKDKIEREMVK